MHLIEILAQVAVLAVLGFICLGALMCVYVFVFLPFVWITSWFFSGIKRLLK
jgi:hypothetical protein